MFEYKTNGTCSSKVRFDLRDGKIYALSFEDGCEGNLKALGVLVEGMDAGEALKKLKGLKCGSRQTSCADQFACAVSKAIEQSK